MRALVLVASSALLLTPLAAALPSVNYYEEGQGACDWRILWVDTGMGPWAEASHYCNDEGYPTEQVGVWDSPVYGAVWSNDDTCAFVVVVFVFESECAPVGTTSLPPGVLP